MIETRLNRLEKKLKGKRNNRHIFFWTGPETDKEVSKLSLEDQKRTIVLKWSIAEELCKIAEPGEFNTEGMPMNKNLNSLRNLDFQIDGEIKRLREKGTPWKQIREIVSGPPLDSVEKEAPIPITKEVESLNEA